MADMTRVIRRNKPNPMGLPPEEASDNLSQPELAPAAPAPAPSVPAPVMVVQAPLDGRSLRRRRRNRRTIVFSSRVTPEFHDTMLRIAEEDEILIVEVLEQALEALEEKRAKQ